MSNRIQIGPSKTIKRLLHAPLISHISQISGVRCNINCFMKFKHESRAHVMPFKIRNYTKMLVKKQKKLNCLPSDKLILIQLDEFTDRANSEI